MSESKHTPGPWTVDGPPWNQIVWSSAENRVCFLAHSNGLDDERDIATGRLIAAAPEMFEALKGALGFIQQHYEPACDADYELINEVRAALSKAGASS